MTPTNKMYLKNNPTSKVYRFKKVFSKVNYKALALVAFFVLAAFFAYAFIRDNKKVIAIGALDVVNKFSNLLPIANDEKVELDVVNQFVQNFTQKDGVTRSFLIMLQNNMELRPGGGFLGQYAIVKIKDGEVVSTYVEEANLLDQRIPNGVATPYALKSMMGMKNWKFRDSNFSPDFPTNVSKAEYFLRLAGVQNKYDGVITVNSQVFNDILEITGPVSAPGSSIVFDSSNAMLKMEEIVEKQYLMNESLDTQNRKWIMKSLAPVIIGKLENVGNISKLAEFFHKELKNKNIMLNFSDANLQALAESVYWDGKVAQTWDGDYLMMVDANMGALKTDYYMRREVSYDLDLTGEKPVVTLNMTYKNTAPYGDWRTSDYHSYLRVYVPAGAKLLENKWVSPRGGSGDELGKTYFGFKLDVVIGQTVDAMIKYELPNNFTIDDYKLLIQKQSGVGDLPVKIHIKTANGEFNQDNVLKGDLKFQMKKQ